MDTITTLAICNEFVKYIAEHYPDIYDEAGGIVYDEGRAISLEELIQENLSD